jgi:hypothetical protein
MNIARTESVYQISNEKIKTLKVSKSDTIHIVSAGPSCRNFNWRSIRGNDIMSINNALYYLPLPVSYHIYNEPIDIERENYKRMTKYIKIKKFTTFRLSGWYMVQLYDDKNLAFQLAINIAIDLGYTKLKLYGFDFGCEGGYIHWWDKEPLLNESIIKQKQEMLDKQSILFKEILNKNKDKIEYITI